MRRRAQKEKKSRENLSRKKKATLLPGYFNRGRTGCHDILYIFYAEENDRSSGRKVGGKAAAVRDGFREGG